MSKAKSTPVKEETKVPESVPHSSELIDEYVADAIETLNKRYDEQSTVTETINKAAEKIKDFRADIKKALDEAGNIPITETPSDTSDKQPDISSTPPNGRYGRKATSDKDPVFSRADYRGIFYSSKLIDKANANVIADYGSTENYHKAKNAAQKTWYHTYHPSTKDAVGVANMAMFRGETYKDAFNQVFYLTTTPGNVAYDEMHIMPEVIDKIRQYERIYGTAEVMTEHGRRVLINSILMNNVTELLPHYYGLEYAKNYPAEMKMSDAEAEHIHALVKTLDLHRKFSEIDKEIFISPLTAKEHYHSLSVPTPAYSSSGHYGVQQQYRKLKVFSSLLGLLIPSEIQNSVIQPTVDRYQEDYGALRNASARLRNAATAYIEGGSLANLLVAIGGYTLIIRKRYDALVDNVEATFIYLSNNGLKFSDVFDDTLGVHKRRFNTSSDSFGSDWETGTF